MPAQLPTPAHQFGYRIMGPAQQVQSGLTGSTITSGQATILPHAFTVGMLHDPASGAWNMDTGASSYLNNSVNSLRENFNTCMYSSISVGDGHSIHVTNTGHSILPTPLKSLHLNNVLITPHIVKILISDRQFFRDNNCTIEFDAFDFSVKDFMTRRVLLRCDSTGIFTQSQLHLLSLMLSLLVNICGINVLDTQGVTFYVVLFLLTLFCVIKRSLPFFCHACQLGKHLRLSFVSSSTVISFCFDIIHSDV
ncbi:hypothetical protein Tco_1070819 [Tanacetum coccineum]|uniref:Uncharacterized protein n=1 Tax=Tanacetum coccineum TaxID=301880 RepID=A0ABQ5HMJ6_9ASTR